MFYFKYLSKKIAILLIRFYQKTISFDHGLLKPLYPNGFCRYHPSCSEYAAQVIEKKGIIKGSFYTIYRVARCNPFSKGGIDDVK